MSDEVVVTIWEDTGPYWQAVREITYQRIEFEPRHLAAGPWSVTVEAGPQASSMTAGRLATTVFRGEWWTWTIVPTLAEDDGDTTVTVQGDDALSMLGWADAWPTPLNPLDEQGQQGNYSGTAGAVITQLATQNLRTRYGLDFDIAAAPSGGPTVRSAPRFDNLLTEVLRVAKRGGVGVRFGLVPTVSANGTRARLRLWFYTPRDLSAARIEFSPADGSLAGWELVETPPTLTRAHVGGVGEGAGQYLLEVTTPQSEADASKWGGHREGYVDGPETFDEQPLRDAGEDALAEGAATTTLTMQAVEPLSARAFEAFAFDKVKARLTDSLTVVDTISAIRVTHEDVGDPDVTPIFGNPDAAAGEEVDAADAQLVALMRQMQAAMKSAQINRKRGAA